MKKDMILIFISISFSFLISAKEKFPYGIYNFLIDDKNYLVYKENKLDVLYSEKFENEAKFRIVKLDNDYYHIENLRGDRILYGDEEKLEFIYKNNLENNKSTEWLFIEENSYQNYIQNKNGCYIILTSSNIICRDDKNSAIKFKIEKLFEEVHNSKEDIELIENEPIDVLIKYIDLTNVTNEIKEIQQLNKNKSNDELKYCVRSILKNIPWIRKIFILMPNKEVSFFIDYELIKEKIIYVNDKDLIGFDSTNILAFQYRSWMMNRFNMSNNFILMDFYNFISKPLKKTDFFFVENDRVVPAIVTQDFVEYDEKLALSNLAKYKKKLENEDIYSPIHSLYSIENTRLFTLKLFNKPLYFPLLTHNAIPCNMKELKELYLLIYNSEFRNCTLDAIYKKDDSIQFQTFYMGFAFNQYNKKIHHISYKYMDDNFENKLNYNFSLFSINTESEKYSSLTYTKTRIIMEYNFPEPTPYETINYSELTKISYNSIYELENDKINIRNKFRKIVIFFITIILILLFTILKKNKNPFEYKIMPYKAEYIKEENRKEIEMIEIKDN